MSSPPEQDLKKCRDEVFSAVGRNLIVFQQLERILKIVLNEGRVSLKFSELEGREGKHPEAYARKMLGELVEPFISRHLTGIDPAGTPDDLGGEPGFSFRFTFALTDAQRTSFRQRLKAMVEQRNAFVHHLLDRLKLGTVEECRETFRQLADQRAELEPLRRDLRNILEAFLESREDAVKHFRAELAKRADGTAPS